MGLPGNSPDAGLALGNRGDRPPVRSLYIHVPFCSHKCHYCDFYSFVDTRDQQNAFLDRLIGELCALAPYAGPLRTVFIGGGTPSLLRLDLWEQLLGELGRLFDLEAIRGLGDKGGGGEFTVECNPETTTAELCALLRAGGVNRVSVGAQSFDPRHLKTLERWHEPANVERAVGLARAAGIPRQSIDLIYAIPGQTLEDWSRDLSRALALGTTHLSCYSLTYEPNTAMTKRLSMGEFVAADEDLEAGMFEHTVAALRAAGLDRYEVSNFARAGHESLHNLAYWRQEQWLAAGPSASGHVDAGRSALPTAVGTTAPRGVATRGSWRWKNVPRLGDYLASGGFAPVVDLERPDPLRLVRERIMMGLRLAEGLDADGLIHDLAEIAPGLVDPLSERAGVIAARGHLVMSRDRWTLTDEGFLLCDGIAGELMRCVVERR